jgi:hypothetical protein
MCRFLFRSYRSEENFLFADFYKHFAPMERGVEAQQLSAELSIAFFLPTAPASCT